MEELSPEFPFELEPDMARIEGELREDILAGDDDVMPLHVEKLDRIGVQRPLEVQSGS